MSGVGKGIAAASIGKILHWSGIKTTSMKIDPYVNVDAGTMNPVEHGEVFVLSDGTECDQDMGHYERFLNQEFSRGNYMTTGSIYSHVIQKERRLEYNGKCVEVVPHIPLEVIARIDAVIKKDKADLAIVEIGGTVGEYQNNLFLEAVRILKLEKPKDVVSVLVSYLPFQGFGMELKTKPTQYAVRALNSMGVQPDMILARAICPLDKSRKRKIAFNCNLKEEDIISAPDIKTVYDVPINFEKDQMSKIILKKLGLKKRNRQNDRSKWITFVHRVKNASQEVKIGIVGKYFTTGNFLLADSYISVIEAIKHACAYYNLQPKIDWLSSEVYEKNPKNLLNLKKYHGIIVPGGFGGRGVEGKINVIKFCREHKIPYLGLCYGMQLMVIEYARSVAKLKKAQTTEIDPNTPDPVIDILLEQRKNMAAKNYGATMRLGAYPAVLKNKTLAYHCYKAPLIYERHRHRHEVNPQYIELLERKGLVFSGFSPDKHLMEIAELPRIKHPFFIGSQFHPEFTSKPLNPSPLFKEFINVCRSRKK